MSDPRLNGSHLGESRHDLYGAAVENLLDGRGIATAEADPLARPPLIFRTPVRREAPPAGGTYALVSLADGHWHPLRVGINTIGRFDDNNIMLKRAALSRRHCAILVHASGSCEVFDTASRNGTFVNRRRVDRADLLPGDILSLVGLEFLLAWVGPYGEIFDSATDSQTEYLIDLSSNA